MKLVIIRHGDPDYENDSLTEKGKREAACLAPRVKAMPFKEVYVSPLGRARETAMASLEPLGITPVIYDWLQEVPSHVERPNDLGHYTIAWDWLPNDWANYENFYSFEKWMEHPNLEKSDIKGIIQDIYKNLELFLNQHGYYKNNKALVTEDDSLDNLHSGRTFRVEKANNDTILFFCHYGLESVILSYLLNISPMQLWHSFCARTTSVTTVVTEERVKGEASFRVIEYGDTSHLYAGGEPCSFAARFCECYDNADERHF